MRKSTWGILLAVLLGILLRGAYVSHLPFTSDEGAYLYDAKILLQGIIPPGDVLVKAPVALAIFAASVFTTQGSLVAARLAVLVIGVATTVPLFYLAQTIFGRREGFWTALVWLLGAGSVSLNIYGITEPLAAFFSVSALTTWVVALKKNSAAKQRNLFLLSGLLMALAFFTRKTAVAVAVPMLLAWLSQPRPKLGDVGWLALGASLLSGAVLGLLYQLYGGVGIMHGLGLQYGDLVVHTLTYGRDNFSWGAQPLWAFDVIGRRAIPLLALSLLAGSYYMRGCLPMIVQSIRQASVLVGVSGAALFVYALYHSPDQRLLVPAYVLWLAWVVVFTVTIHKRALAASTHHSMLIPLLWLGSLTALYAGWPTFLPDYTFDFFPALTLLAGVALGSVGTFPQPLRTGVISLLVASNIFSLDVAWRTPWTGLFARHAVIEAAEQLQAQVPLSESIFTAAVIVPYISDHQVFAHVAHPFWYHYQFISDETKNTFLPPLSQFMEAATNQEFAWALVDQTTAYAYFTPAPELRQIITRRWEQVAEIDNQTKFRSNRLRLYHAPHH